MHVTAGFLLGFSLLTAYPGSERQGWDFELIVSLLPICSSDTVGESMPWEHSDCSVHTGHLGLMVAQTVHRTMISTLISHTS